MCGQIMKIFIFLTALFWSVSQVFADECKTKPDECTPKNLCEVATEIKNGKTIWSEAIKSNEHVVFAKELGINCGVSDSLALCQTDPNECKISDLCSFATVGSDHKIKWNEEHASEHVKLAKEYGLKCEVASDSTVNAQDRYEKSGVWIEAPKKLNSSTNTEENSFKTPREDEEKNEKIDALNKEVARLALLLNEAKDTEQESINEIKNLQNRLNAALLKAASEEKSARKLNQAQQSATSNDSCKNNPKNCNSGSICYFATTTKFGKKIWEERNSFTRHVQEAKSRGLNCGVPDAALTKVDKCTVTTPQFCSTRELCDLATFKQLGTKRWKNGKYAVYVDEAKKRKLSCGATKVAPGQSQLKLCSLAPSSCSYKQLCTIATTEKLLRVYANQSVKVRVWNTRKAEHVAYAKRKNFCQVTQVDQVCSVNSAKACSSEMLCRYATISYGTIKYMTSWTVVSSYQGYVKEAKKRELTCGTKTRRTPLSTIETQPVSMTFEKSHFLKLSHLQRKQLQYALKELGYYTSSVDGLYGPNTQRAVRDYAENKGINRNYPNSILRQLKAEVSVPSSFATAKKTTSNAVKQGSTKSHYNGLKPIASNPSLSAKQAWIKCATRANTAHRNAYKSYSTPKYGSTTNCTLNATRTGIIINGKLDCESSPQHGGFVGGIANTLGRASVAKAAAESTMSSCLTKHGWKR